MSAPPVIDLASTFASIDAFWSPRVAAEVNGHQIRLARLDGTFCWHAHEHEDELFLVIRGTLQLKFRDAVRTVGPGQMVCIPRGVEHRPVAEEEVHVLLFEPGSTVSTGTTDDPRRVERPPTIEPPPAS